jgi:hypothetical protein
MYQKDIWITEMGFSAAAISQAVRAERFEAMRAMIVNEWPTTVAGAIGYTFHDADDENMGIWDTASWETWAGNPAPIDPLTCPHPDLVFNNGALDLVCQRCGQIMAAVNESGSDPAPLTQGQAANGLAGQHRVNA